MTNRPVFVPTRQAFPLVVERSVPFRWNAGFSISQKRKNVAALHSAARSAGIGHLLEVSTKSEEDIGCDLSAFNLHVGVGPGWTAPIEVAYQGSKVFEEGGPYVDLFSVSPREAKMDLRLKQSGALIGFEFGGLHFPLSPPTAFYDWLFLRAFVRKKDLLSRIMEYDGFTDIEFNPAKSLNCQARACAAAVSLTTTGELNVFAKSFARFASRLAGLDQTAPGQLPAQHSLAV